MANKRYKPEEVVQKLRQVDVLVGQGMQHSRRYDPPRRGVRHDAVVADTAAGRRAERCG